MNDFNRKAHWENIYSTKSLQEVSWYQPHPITSLEAISSLNLPLTAKIIDIGGGDSFLVDHLLDLGYQNLSVLDISSAAIERAKTRLGQRADLVNWIVMDVINFNPMEEYDLWHDRAAFHFLTNPSEINHYKKIIQEHIGPQGSMIIGTFSDSGPKKCSGIEIKQYAVEDLTALFESDFTQVNGFNIDHPTPFDTIQNFTFCTFVKK